MPNTFRGKISSTSWSTTGLGCHLSPRPRDRAPNVLVLTWDDVGYGTMDISSRGGRWNARHPARSEERGVKFANFHTTALCSPDRAGAAAHRAQCDQVQRHGDHRRVLVGLPGHLGTRMPVSRTATCMSEVLAEHGYNTYCVGKWRLTPGGGVQPRGVQRTVAAPGAGSNASTDQLGGETTTGIPTSSTTTTRSTRRVAPRTAITSPTTSSSKAIEFVATRRSSSRTSRSSCTSRRTPARAAQVPLEWADKYKGAFNQGYEAIRAGILARQVEMGLLPEGTELSRSIRTASLDARVPTASRGPRSTRYGRGSCAQRRRTAAVHASGREPRLHLVLDTTSAAYSISSETSGQLDNTIIVVISDNGASGEGGPNGEFNEWRLLSTVSPATRRSRSSASTSSARRSRTTTTTPGGVGVRHAVRRTGNGRPAPKVASPTCAFCRGRQRSRPTRRRAGPVHPRGRCRADHLRAAVLRDRTARGDQLLSPIEGESFAKALTDATAPGQTPFYTMLGQRSIYHQGWLASTVHPPLAGWGAFEKDEWELFHLETDRSQTTNVAADDPTRLEALKQLWFYYAGVSTTVCRSTIAPRSTVPRGTTTRRTQSRYEYFPDCADVPESAGVAINGRSYTIPAGVELDSADAEELPRTAASRRPRLYVNSGSSA